MPLPICVVTPTGIEAAPYQVESLADVALKEPQGVYTLGRTYHRFEVLLFNDHMDRLEQSARLEGIDVHLDRNRLRAALRTLITPTDFADSRWRMTIPFNAPKSTILTLGRFEPVPQEIAQHGCRVISLHVMRHNPIAKTTTWAKERISTVQTLPSGIYEGILTTPDGTFLECTSSNFYAIKQGVLYTANEGILEGIARRILLTVAPEILPVKLKAVRNSDTLDEAFLTSAGRGIVPIVEIDGVTIGTGQPGEFVTQLRDAYQKYTTNHLELL